MLKLVYKYAIDLSSAGPKLVLPMAYMKADWKVDQMAEQMEIQKDWWVYLLALMMVLQ